MPRVPLPATLASSTPLLTSSCKSCLDGARIAPGKAGDVLRRIRRVGIVVEETHQIPLDERIDLLAHKVEQAGVDPRAAMSLLLPP